MIVFLKIFSQNVTVPPVGISDTENYIYTREYLEPTATSNEEKKQIQSIIYFDGLGRPKQSIAIKASPTEKDLVTTITYDEYGRQVDFWLPTPMTSLSGGIQTNVEANAISFYDDSNPFSHKKFESTPVDRIQQEVQAGQDWSGKPVQFDYETNLNDNVINFSTSGTLWPNSASNCNLVKNSNYADATLYKNRITDEDGKVSVEFKNGQEQIILTRKYDEDNEIDTYYVYNEFNQLAFVLSPLASKAFKVKIEGTIFNSDTDPVLNELCYQYRYDRRNRVVEKKLPGKGWEYMVYDKADRPILTQDAVMRGLNRWLFTKYDQFGRVIYTGSISANSETRFSLQEDIKNLVITESRDDDNGFLQNGMTINYTKVHYGNIFTIYSVNYYDTYPIGTVFPIDNKIQTVSILKDNDTIGETRSTKSLSTASFVKNIENDNWTKNYIFYDKKGRIIGNHSINHLGGYNNIERILDFNGLPHQIFTYHSRLSTQKPYVTIKERFEYNPFNQALEKHYHEVVGKTDEELLTYNQYNDIGKLVKKQVGNNIQEIDYTYNIRGWMTSINNPTTLGTKLFAYEIRYNNPKDNAIAPARFNGNIAEVDWISSTGVLKRYGYQYDNVNRLLAGIYQEANTAPATITHDNDEIITYDLNGNIKTLNRFTKGRVSAIQIDRLVYTYENNNQSNRLESIHDNPGATPNISGYPGGGQIITYDANGNMETMPDKGIVDKITYNFLNLPTMISQRGNTSTFLYRADGVKLKKTYKLVNKLGTTIINTEYLDGFQYSTPNTEPIRSALQEQDDITMSSTKAGNEEAFLSLDARVIAPGNPSIVKLILSFVPTAEGFYDYENLRYIYQYKDHLGNVRVSYVKDGTSLKVMDTNEYYPFGLSFIKGNTFINSVYDPMAIPYNYKYQGQEIQETGFYSFKWRNYMPDVGRFFNIDPLAEKYDDYTPYQFSSNQPVHGREIEGLENANDLNKRFSPQQRAIFDKKVQAYATEAQRNFSNVFNGTLSVEPKFGALGGEVGFTVGPLKGNVGAAVAKVEGSLNQQSKSIKIKADGLSAEGSLGIKSAKMEGSIAAISMEGEGTIMNGKPSGKFNAQGGKVEGKLKSGDISFDLSDLKIGGDFKVFKALHIGAEFNLGEAVSGVINSIGMVTTAAQNYIQEKFNDVTQQINKK